MQTEHCLAKMDKPREVGTALDLGPGSDQSRDDEAQRAGPTDGESPARP